MSNLQFLPDNDTQTSANSLPNDWNLPTEKSPTEETTHFDGKIIARMPDLGSNNFAKNIKTSTLPIWNRLYLHTLPIMQQKIPESVRSFVRTRQQLFQHMTTFGAVLLLCGMSLLFLNHTEKEPTNDSVAAVDPLPENTETSAIAVVAPAKQESAFAPISLPESNNSSSTGSTIPVADFAAVQNSVASSSEQADLLGNRSTTQPYSPWDVKQSENSPASSDAVAAVPPPSPPPVAMAPMTPIPVSPIPSPMSMPVSPYEQQLGGRTSPPVRPPIDPFVQANNPNVPPGMMPMHERLEYMVNTSPQDAPRSASAVSPYPPPFVAVQGGAPVNLPHNQYSSPYGQHGQYVPHAVQPNYAPQSNVPIPSGVSTLPQQQGYYLQPHGATAVPHPVGNFYAPPAYHRVY